MPGNFQLIRLGDGQGAADLRVAMAGGYDGCIENGEPVETEPGNSVGPVVQGINTRFGQYEGPMQGTQSTYPPDVVVGQPGGPLTYDTPSDTIYQGATAITDASQIDFNPDTYEGLINNHAYDYAPAPAGIGVHDRRLMALPIGDCSTTTNGQGQVPVLGCGGYVR